MHAMVFAVSPGVSSLLCTPALAITLSLRPHDMTLLLDGCWPIFGHGFLPPHPWLRPLCFHGHEYCRFFPSAATFHALHARLAGIHAVRSFRLHSFARRVAHATSPLHAWPRGPLCARLPAQLAREGLAAAHALFSRGRTNGGSGCEAPLETCVGTTDAWRQVSMHDWAFADCSQ
jgi:hypothetical protein